MPISMERRKMLNKKEEQIINLRRDGWSDEEIGTVFGMSRQGVWEARKRFYDRTGTTSHEIDNSEKPLDKYTNRMYTTNN